MRNLIAALSIFAICLLQVPVVLAQKTSAKSASEKTAKPDPQFIYVLRLMPDYQVEANWTEETNKIVGAHFVRLKEATAKGTVLMAGRTEYGVDNPEMFGIVVFSAKDLDAAHEFMNSDPAVMLKVMKAEVHPFSVALMKGKQ